jgi:hypothetical protein
MPRPGEAWTSSLPPAPEEPKEEEVEEEEVEGEVEVEAVEARVSQMSVAAEKTATASITLKGNSSSSGAKSSPKKKSASNGTSGPKKDPKKKKKTTGSSGQASDSGVVYGVERSLLAYRNNEALLTEYLNTLTPAVVFPSEKSSVLEADVVVELLLAVSKCYGEKQGMWGSVLTWFSAVVSLSSFGFIKSLLSEQQVTQLHDALGRCEQGGDCDTVELEVLKNAFGIVVA